MTPSPQAVLAQFKRARKSIRTWPAWMQAATIYRAAAFPRAPSTPGEKK